MAEVLAAQPNPSLLAVIKTAQAWGKSPSFMLTGAGEWGERDRVLAIGYQLYQGMLCPECGNPLTVCRDEGNAGWWETSTATCHAAKAVAERTSEPGYKPQPGQIIYPVLEKAEGGAPGYGAPPEGWKF